MAFVALLDACVLYPAPLRDLLMRLAVAGLFRAKWSERIHEEWIRGVLREQPDLEERLSRTRALMNKALPDASVEGYKDIETSLSLPDQDDRHVLAAAIVGRADMIVTSNLKDFPETTLAAYNIEAQHPDVFICNTLTLDPPRALTAIRDQRIALKNPEQTVSDFLDTLRRQQLPDTVAYLNEWAEFL